MEGFIPKYHPGSVGLIKHSLVLTLTKIISGGDSILTRHNRDKYLRGMRDLLISSLSFFFIKYIENKLGFDNVNKVLLFT